MKSGHGERVPSAKAVPAAARSRRIVRWSSAGSIVNLRAPRERALEEKRPPILLTDRHDHLEHFAARLQSFTRHLVVLHGGMKPKERRGVIEQQLASIPDGEERLLIATGRYIGEGFDDARLDTLFLALPVSWKGTLIQYTGRLHRLHPGKAEVRIYDYVDSAVPVLMKMFAKRLRGYRAIGYARDAAPLGFQETEGEAGLDADDRSPDLEQELCRQVR
jgi:superfamily II DNA or RNA helicase